MCVEAYLFGKVEIELHVLGICDIEKGVLSDIILTETRHIGESTEEIACCFDICSEGKLVIVISDAETHLHYEQVLVIIS